MTSSNAELGIYWKLPLFEIYFLFFFVFITGKDITDEVLKNAVAPKKCITIQPQIAFEYDVNYTTPVRNKA